MVPNLSSNTCATVSGGLLALALFFSLPRPLTTVQAQAPDELSYTTAQAERGRAVYAEQCASCHGPNLDDGAFAPPLTGVDFRTKWGQQSAEPLFTYTATRMPPNRRDRSATRATPISWRSSFSRTARRPAIGSS